MNRIIILIILCLPLWSCATYYATRDDVVGQIRSWEQQDEYGSIFKTLDRIDPKHAQYRQLQHMKPRLQEDAQKFEYSVASSALKLAQQHDWQAALQTFDEGLDKYPQSSYLESEREKFLADREQYLHYLERKYLYERAQWLINAVPQQQKIVDTNPDNSPQKKRLKKLQTLSVETAEQLAIYGKEALRENRFMVASRSLSLANQLQPDDEYNQLLKQIETAQKRQTIQKRVEKKPEVTTKQTGAKRSNLKRLHSDLQLAQNNQDWLEAIDLLVEIEKLAPDSPQTGQARKALDREVNAHVQQQIKMGEHQYSQGDFKVALETWEAVHPLAPENKALNEYILRARRVINSLKELSTRPPAIRFPVEDESQASPD